jgi:hypothetical protein
MSYGILKQILAVHLAQIKQANRFNNERQLYRFYPPKRKENLLI